MTRIDGRTGNPDGYRAATGMHVHATVLRCLAVLALATAVIHFAVAGEHFQEYWVFGVFMLVSAFLQLGWSIAAVTRPARSLLWGGVVLNGGIVVVYLLTRTVGDMVGPTPTAVEPVGFGDAFCTVLEVIVVIGCLWVLADATGDRAVDRRLWTAAPAATAVVTAVLLSVALVDGGPEMVMTAGDTSAAGMAGMSGMSTSPTQQLHLATDSPAGDITLPDPNMVMPPGMRMATSGVCAALPTKAQQQAAVDLVNASWAETGLYRSLATAQADGYRAITPRGAAVVHYLNPAFYRATLRGGVVLDPEQPQSLVYANTPKGAVLVAAMYITTPGGDLPQPGGCLNQWHVHTNLCMSHGVVVGEADPTCPTGSTNRVTPPMMHIWFVPIPGGPTAVDAPDDQVVAAAERVSSPANGTA